MLCKTYEHTKNNDTLTLYIFIYIYIHIYIEDKRGAAGGSGRSYLYSTLVFGTNQEMNQSQLFQCISYYKRRSHYLPQICHRGHFEILHLIFSRQSNIITYFPRVK